MIALIRVTSLKHFWVILFVLNDVNRKFAARSEEEIIVKLKGGSCFKTLPVESFIETMVVPRPVP
jgi:hypothetical protein